MFERLRQLARDEHGWGKVWTGLAVAVALAGGGLIYQQVTSGDGQPPSPAQIWVAVSGSDATCQRGNQSLPCRTLGKAYDIAELGDTVEIAAGSYGNDTFSGSTKSGSGRVTFQPASGASPTFGTIRPETSNHIELKDFSADTVFMHLSEDVILRNMSLHLFFARGALDVQMLGGEVANLQNGDSPTVGAYSGERVSTNVTFDGVAFHDIGRQDCPGCHVECLYIQESDGVTVKNSTFTRCDVMDLFSDTILGAGLGVNNLTIENNWFDTPGPSVSNALRLRPYPDTNANMTVRYNSFEYGASISIDPAATYTNATLTGNIGHSGSCPPSGWTSSYNVFGSGDPTCGTGDTTAASFGYVDESGFDYHITSGSAARNHGNPGSFPATDIDGQSRPNGTVDAGSDEIP